jgi:hypothetical protein
LPVWACFLALEAFLAGSSAGVLLSSFFFPLVLPRKKLFLGARFLGPSPPLCERLVSFFSCSDIQSLLRFQFILFFITKREGAKQRRADNSRKKFQSKGGFPFGGAMKNNRLPP